LRAFGCLSKQQFLNEYLKKLTRLRQAPTAYGPAPHKPVLLLALLDGIEKGWITGNRVYLTPDLVAAFRGPLVVAVQTDQSPEFTLPFFTCRAAGSGGWCGADGQPLRDFTKSLQRMQELVDYATLDEPLYALLLDPVTRNVLRVALLDRYFPAAKAAYLQRKGHRGLPR
jgi:putative restriction endonuclease